jgi:2-hydroxy-6-oxonona-2,4-dienedioate hydrolase
LPLDPSPAAQADAYAALLDELGICRVFVVALSAGSPSALEFALRHADRCAALVFISMADHPRTVPTGQRAVAIDLLSSSDFLFWWQSTHARRTLRRVIGVPRPRSGRQLTNEDRAFLAEMRRLCLPIRPRRLGIRNDLRILSTDGSRPFERVEVPTLIVHAVDDALAPFHQARAAAERIRNASFIALDTGGHFMLGRQEMVRAEVGRFLEANRFETARRAN